MKFSGVTILQGVEFSIFPIDFEWALQQCSATALPVIITQHHSILARAACLPRELYVSLALMSLFLFGSQLMKASAEYRIYLTGRLGGVHAFGYNTAESEPIWTKSGALWVHCWGLALIDFGCDPRSNSDSLRDGQIFWQINNAQFHRFPVGQVSRNLNTTTSIVSL